MTGWEDAAHLLCIRLDALGDVLMTTPALRALKASNPGRRLTLLTSASGASIARLVPEIDSVITYAAPWMKSTTPRADARADLGMADRLRALRFDGAVIFTVNSQSPLPAALLCFLADIPRRLAHCRENPYQLLTDWIPELEPATVVRHEVQRQMDLVGSIGCTIQDDRLSLRVNPADTAGVGERLARRRVRASGPLVVVHAGASAASRRYPGRYFAAAARQLFEELDCDIVFTGTADEQPLVDEIRHQMGAPSTSLAGRLSLGEMAALLGQAALLVSNNTGPVHIAAAMGTPVVDLYALTNPQHTPWRVPSRVLFHDVPCRYCYNSVCPEGHHDCLQRVEPAAVVEAARALLDEGKPATASSLPPPGAGTSPPAAPPLAAGLASGGPA